MTVLGVISALQLFVIAWLVRDRAQERERTSQQIDGLLQRIQAPQAATAAYHYDREPYSPPAVDTTDEGDKDFWEAKEEMAERLAKAEVNGGG